uniref:G_PROTEIN_RECEP_F1_2 domain-containing protein n=1 Tax=Syphacia muris TaxID=451379 RepID=A0A0N5AEM7_9BILA
MLQKSLLSISLASSYIRSRNRLLVLFFIITCLLILLVLCNIAFCIGRFIFGKFGARRYQAHPTKRGRFYLLLLLFFIAWFTVVSFTALVVYGAIDFYTYVPESNNFDSYSVWICTLCYCKSYHPIDRSVLSNRMGVLMIHLSMFLLIFSPLLILFANFMLVYAQMYTDLCPQIQSRVSYLNLVWICCLVIGIILSLCTVILLKMSKYFLRMNTEYYWNSNENYSTLSSVRPNSNNKHSTVCSAF